MFLENMETETQKEEIKPAGRPKLYASAEEVKTLGSKVDEIGSVLNKVLEALEKKTEAPKTEQEKKVETATPNKFTVNPEWEEAAKNILGDALDHTEVNYERSGGVVFTVVIALDKSNATKDYLERCKIDRRSKPIGGTGIDGVIEWCNLVKGNLNHK